MHKGNSIVSTPMLAGITLSIALHGAVLFNNGIYTPPVPALERGRTVVQLTLIPSLATKAATPEPPAEKPMEQPAEEAPVPIPVEPVAEPTSVVKTATVDSPDQEASLQKDKGVATAAALVGFFRPAYPRISKRRGETGTVTLSVQVRPDGSVDRVSLLRSSGYRRLDEAALKAAQMTTFSPAKRFGRNIESETELSFTFRLTDE